MPSSNGITFERVWFRSLVFSKFANFVLFTIGNMAAAGVYFSLFGHWWYTFLDRKFPPKARNAVRNKIFAEMVMGPILVTSVFGLMGTLRGHSVATMWRNVVSNFVIICNVSVVFWFCILH